MISHIVAWFYTPWISSEIPLDDWKRPLPLPSQVGGGECSTHFNVTFLLILTE